METRELSVVVLSRQSPLKMNMFDFCAWFCDWTKGTILFIKSNLDRDLLTSCEISSQAWIDCKAEATRPVDRALICKPGKCYYLCLSVINRLFNNQGKWKRDSHPSFPSNFCLSPLLFVFVHSEFRHSHHKIIENMTVVILPYAKHSGTHKLNISRSMWNGGLLRLKVSPALVAKLWFSCTVAKDPY